MRAPSAAQAPEFSTILRVFCGRRESHRVFFFKEYKTTLLERVNPQRLSKRDFIASGRPLVMDSMCDWVKSLHAVLEHLHLHNLVHNDITPANIMLDESNTPVIIE